MPAEAPLFDDRQFQLLSSPAAAFAANAYSRMIADTDLAGDLQGFAIKVWVAATFTTFTANGLTGAFTGFEMPAGSLITGVGLITAVQLSGGTIQVLEFDAPEA